MCSAEIAVPAPPPVPACPTLRRANLLYLISVLLVLTAGSAFQYRDFRRGLILTELLLILVPAIVAAGETDAFAPALRMRRVGWRICLLGVAIGAALFPVAVVVGILTERFLGYSIPPPSSFWPSNASQAALQFLAMAVAAPFCEEMLFRGYILAAYERLGLRPVRVILVVAGLFTVYHFSLQRTPVVAIAALAITYLAWRTGSIWPGMAAHFGANAVAACLVIATGLKDLPKEDRLDARLLAAAAIGAVVMAASLWWIDRRTPAPPPVEADPREERRRTLWPLYIVGVLWILIVILEFVASGSWKTPAPGAA